MLKARISLLLLLGALLGLFGQGMAYAAGPALAPKVAASHSMASGRDCADMASAQKQAPESPCKGITLACIAQMGCIIPMTFEPERPAAKRLSVPQLAATWPPSLILAGLEIAPDPEPPTV